MPVLTYDIVFGTGKLEKLNLSHNSITDIRRSKCLSDVICYTIFRSLFLFLIILGVIGNLTRLRVLDLSYNQLEDIASDPELFRLPVNTSELYLSHNILNNLPWKHIRNVTHVDVLDISYNRFDSFNLPLTNMVENGTMIYFEGCSVIISPMFLFSHSVFLLIGNPLNCDCFTRPLKRYFSSALSVPDAYRAIKCASPKHLAGQSLYDVTPNMLVCPQNVNNTQLLEQQPDLYDITPDFKFRDIKM